MGKSIGLTASDGCGGGAGGLVGYKPRCDAECAELALGRTLDVFNPHVG